MSLKELFVGVNLEEAKIRAFPADEGKPAYTRRTVVALSETESFLVGKRPDKTPYIGYRGTDGDQWMDNDDLKDPAVVSQWKAVRALKSTPDQEILDAYSEDDEDEI